MINNLRESHLYDLLPEGIVEMDEKGLIQAVVLGFQDRLEDLRSYTRKLNYFFDPTLLPDAENNVVIVELLSEQGKLYRHSLDYDDTTPTGGQALVRWVIAQLGFDQEQESRVQSVYYGRDLLRLVDINTLQYLADTIGAILYQTEILDGTDTVGAHRQLIQTYFPRLKIKGTVMSFDVLGRILGFDDIRITPLWTRVSPRRPEDIGHADNNADFSYGADYYPQQFINSFYDPNVTRDGAFYAWAGTVSNVPTSTRYYTEVINGFNPWIEVSILSVSSYGTVVHPASGSYALANGGPHVQAYVDPADSGVRFKSLPEGAAANGLLVHVADAGTDKVISITDRLSAIKYRSSYFDVGLTVLDERFESVFGTRSASTNTDLANGTYTVDGVPVSPYRAWAAGSVSTGLDTNDWVTHIQNNAPVVFLPRQQATANDRQLNTADLNAAGAQVMQAFEEVRAATRFPRRASTGLAFFSQVGYAPYIPTGGPIIQTNGTVYNYSGSMPTAPLPPYTAEMTVVVPASFDIFCGADVGNSYRLWHSTTYPGTILPPNPPWQLMTETVAYGSPIHYYYAIQVGEVSHFFIWSDTANRTVATGIVYNPTTRTFVVQSESSGTSDSVWYYRLGDPSSTNFLGLGVYDFSTGTFGASFWALPPGNSLIYPFYTTTSTEVIRPEPPIGALKVYQDRPEDEFGSGDSVAEFADEYPWRREVVHGGVLMETSFYAPIVPDVAVYPLAQETSVFDQTGAEQSIYAIVPTVGDRLRMVYDPRPTDASYAPAYPGVAYSGTIKDLSAIDWTLAAGQTDYDTIFEPGYGLYVAGLCNGVLVADLPKFNGLHHREGLELWLPFNEHLVDALTPQDHGYHGAVAATAGIVDLDRIWDDSRGWCLTMRPGATITVTEDFECASDLTISFWLRTPFGYTGASVTTVFSYGPFQVDLDSATGTLTCYKVRTDNTRSAMSTTQVLSNTWLFIALTTEMGLYDMAVNSGFGDLSAFNAADSYTANPLKSPVDEPLVLAAGELGYVISDLRLWSVAKSMIGPVVYTGDGSECDFIRYHRPTATVVTYPLGVVTAVNGGDRYGMKLLANGWIAPADLPTSIRRPPMALVLRYDSMGSYAAESRFKETGLGGGRELPATYLLGNQYTELTADGAVVVAGTQGYAPAFNARGWFSAESYSGTYLVSTGSGATGSIYTPVWSGVPYPFPNPMAETNTIRDRIWVKGDTGYVYELTLSGSRAATSIVGTPIFRDRPANEQIMDPIWGALATDGTYHAVSGTAVIDGTVHSSYGTVFISAPGDYSGTTVVYLPNLAHAEQPTGPELFWAIAGNAYLTFAAGTVKALQYTGTVTSTPLYMYLNSRVVENAIAGTSLFQLVSAYSRWTDKGATADDQDIDTTGNPTIVDGSGVLQVACIGRAGNLDFENKGALTPGYYNLSIEVGNLGVVDADFNGFDVEITINSNVFQTKLLAGSTGFNLRGTETMQIYLPDNLTNAKWLLSLFWSNPASDPSRGAKRQLAVYSYRLERVGTEIFQVSAVPSGPNRLVTLTRTHVSTYNGTVPGGWIKTINSYGNYASYAHESTLVPSSDSATSVDPVSNVLTGRTNEKTSDIIIPSPDVVVADAPDLPYPVYWVP